MNLLHTQNIVKQDALRKLKNGDTSVLNGLPPVVAMQIGMEMQKEIGVYEEPTLYDRKKVGNAMLERMQDSGVKEALIKRIEEEEKATR
jgi:hypothetical protein